MYSHLRRKTILNVFNTRLADICHKPSRTRRKSMRYKTLKEGEKSRIVSKAVMKSVQVIF